MFEICGVTYDHTINYGSCLQAYALKRAIEQIDLNGEQIHYTQLAIHYMKDKPGAPPLDRMIIEIIQLPLTLFQRKYLDFDPMILLSKSEELNDRYDAFVCGSDVIWNPDFNYGLEIYYLKFAKKYAFSYAASFGRAELSSGYGSSLQERLSQLRCISVREASGVDIIREYTNYDARVDVDPVLLLTKKEWEILAGKKRKKKEYIFVYTTHFNKKIESFYTKLHRQTGLPIKIYASSFKMSDYYKSGSGLHYPEKWLRQIRDARYVVTNSFHATVFSTVFHKDFFTVANEPIGKGIYVRMSDYLNEIGLPERMIYDVPEVISLDTIDFMGIDEKIENLRNRSIKYLRSNLEAAYTEKSE